MPAITAEHSAKIKRGQARRRARDLGLTVPDHLELKEIEKMIEMHKAGKTPPAPPVEQAAPVLSGQQEQQAAPTNENVNELLALLRTQQGQINVLQGQLTALSDARKKDTGSIPASMVSSADALEEPVTLFCPMKIFVVASKNVNGVSVEPPFRKSYVFDEVANSIQRVGDEDQMRYVSALTLHTKRERDWFLGNPLTGEVPHPSLNSYFYVDKKHALTADNAQIKYIMRLNASLRTRHLNDLIKQATEMKLEVSSSMGHEDLVSLISQSLAKVAMQQEMAAEQSVSIVLQKETLARNVEAVV